MNNEHFPLHTAPDEVGPPLPPSPEHVDENMKAAEAAPVRPKLRMRRKTLSRKNRCEEPEASSYVGTRKRGRLSKPKKVLCGELTVNCRKCGTSKIYYPARTKFFSCAEIDGRLFKVKRISEKIVLGGAYRKEPMKRTAYTCRKRNVP